MTQWSEVLRNWSVGAGLLALALGGLVFPDAAKAQTPDQGITFSRDIAPILQRSCQYCHNATGVAPMPLQTYQQVRRYARRIKEKTGIRDRAGAMPPWYLERDIGIQHFKDDRSLSDEEVAAIAAWADNGAPEGDPSDLPEPLDFGEEAVWLAGEPDLIVESSDIFMPGGQPDAWNSIEPILIPLEKDRWIRSVEVKEVNDFDPSASDRKTVGGRFIVHHLTYQTRVLGEEEASAESTRWPVHEVGRGADIFDDDAGRLLRAGSSIVSGRLHQHSNGIDTTAKLLFGFRFHPEGYEPKYRGARVSLGNGVDIDIEGMKAGQELHAYEVLEQHTKFVTFEPHLHAPGERMCIEAIWGHQVETLNCVGYDHNWVKAYTYEDGYEPILPKGTIVHMVGYMNTTTDNPNIADPRNWTGAGNRSVENMFLELGMQVAMTDEQFLEEMAERVERFGLTRNDHVIGCPLCTHAVPLPSPVTVVTVTADSDGP